MGTLEWRREGLRIRNVGLPEGHGKGPKIGDFSLPSSSEDLHRVWNPAKMGGRGAGEGRMLSGT